MDISLFTNKKFLELKKIEDFEVPKDDPFKYDVLNRSGQAAALTKVVTAYKKGAVIALNSAWGTGKTTFIRMWKQQLLNEHYHVIYYNSWEDDMNSEPLFSMLKNLKKETRKDNTKLKKVLEEGAKIITSIAMGALTEWSGALGGVVKAGVKGGTTQLEKVIHSALDGKDDTSVMMSSFKNCLKTFAKSLCKDEKPMVYIIDELDRCNPTFAVKVLERVKHLFDVPNVVFVLAVDMEQLGYSIEGYFGSDKLNSQEYLRRFIDLYYNLPIPGLRDYCEHLYSYYDFDEFIQDENMGDQNVGDCLFTLEMLIKTQDLTLRQLERIFMAVRFAYLDNNLNSSDIQLGGFEQQFRGILFFIAFLKIRNPELYNNIKYRKYTLKDLEKELIKYNLFFFDENGNRIFSFIFEMALILFLYCWDLRHYTILSGITDINDPSYTDELEICKKKVLNLKTFEESIDYKQSIEPFLNKIKINTGLRFWLEKMDMNDMFY